MHGRTLRSLPKDFSPKPGTFDQSVYREREAEAFQLWAASYVLEKFGFYSYASALQRIGSSICTQTIGPYNEKK